ncbi:hypothetical protein LSCM4_04886 [Leishmania orientalis]|uniref:Uncharacterized protein n=1 Tax=Leishmania orientalis TaxID=2249476 RepID=A0A836H0T1_9TRYP|nr:hypothetical protein LSCM4_04886 [Leishmania orientalis]
MATGHAAVGRIGERRCNRRAPTREVPLPSSSLCECVASSFPSSLPVARSQVRPGYAIKGAPATAWNVLDLALTLPQRFRTTVMPTADVSNARGRAADYDEETVCRRCSSNESSPRSCRSLVQIGLTELRALFCTGASGDETTLRQLPAGPPLLMHAPVFARCTRLRCVLFDVVLHGGAGDPGMVASGLYAPNALAGALDVALCAHTSARFTEEEEASERHGSRDGLSLQAASSVSGAALTLASILRVLQPLSHLSALSIGLTLARPAFPGSDSAKCAGASTQWSFVERGSSFSMPYDALWAHWLAITRPAASRLEGSRLNSASSFPVGDHNDDFAVWGRLQHYAERATTALFGEESAGFAAPQHAHLCALLAVLGDVRACATRRFISDPLPILLFDAFSVAQRLLFQWFTFLGLRSASSSHCRPSLELSTEIHAIVFARGWLEELCACHSICSLEHWLHLVAQWLTVRVLEAALKSLPSMVECEREKMSAAETHVLFRVDVDSSSSGAAGLCPGVDGAVRPAREKGGLAHLRPSRWMRYRATASAPAAALPSLPSITAALPELPKEEAVLVCVLERLMKASIGPSDDSRKPLCRPSAAHALVLEPEVHGVVTCRLHLGSPPHKWQRHDSFTPDVGAPPLSQRFAAESPTLSSAPPPARRAHAPVVAALLSWYAVDFEALFSQFYRVWRLARRYRSRYPAESCGGIGAADAAALPLDNLWRGIVDKAVRYHSGGTGGRGQADAIPALGLLSRCLLLAMWMSLAVVDVDDDVGAVTATNTIRSQCCASHVGSASLPLAWKGTLYYSSRRNALHVRDWGTALHLRRVASCLSASEDQDMGSEISDAGSLQREDARRRACGAAVRLAASIVVSSFARARAAVAAAAEARARREAQPNARLSCSEIRGVPADATTAYRGAGDSNGNGSRWFFDTDGSDGTAAEEEDACVLLNWSCDSVKEETGPCEGSSRVALAQQPHANERAGDDDSLSSNHPLRSASLQSSWVIDSIEEFAEASECRIGQPPESHTSAPQVEANQQPSSLAPAAAAPLLDLESHLRELLTHGAVSELLWLVGLAERLARRACEDGEAAARQCLASQAWSHSVKVVTQRRPGASSTLDADAVLLHEDEQPPAHAAASKAGEFVLTRQTPFTLTSSKAARLESEEVSARGTLCGAEHRLRQHVEACCTHIGALLRLQDQEASRRLHVRQLSELELEELQIRWRTVSVPECMLRSLLRETVAAGTRKALPGQEEPQQRQRCARAAHSSRLGCTSTRHRSEQRGSAAAPKVEFSPPLAPLAGEAWAHRMFLLCGEVKESGTEAPGCRSQRSTRATADASHGSSSCQRDQQEPLLESPCTPPLAMQPRRASRHGYSSKSTARVPALSHAPAVTTHSSVPVVSVSLRGAPSSSPVRTLARRCLSELPLNHSRNDVHPACIAPSHRLELPPSTAVRRCPLTELGDALADRASPKRKAVLQRYGDARDDEATSRQSTAGAGASVAVAEEMRLPTAMKCEHADDERTTSPLDIARPGLCIAKERMAPHAGPRISVTPGVFAHTTAHSASATSVPPRRLRKPVVTWSDDVQQY